MSRALGGKVRTCTLVMAVLAAVVVTGCGSGDGVVEASDEVAVTTSPSTADEPDPTGTATEDPVKTIAEETTSAPEEAPEPAMTEEAVPSSDVIVVSESAIFTTPAEAAYCIINGPTNDMAALISCEVAQNSVPPGELLMGFCDSEGFGWYFNFFADSGDGGFACNHHDGITTGGGNPHYWQDDPWIDPNHVVTLPSGARVAVLGYGRTMRAGDMDCSVQPDGLTCQANGSGHGFMVNSASYITW